MLSDLTYGLRFEKIWWFKSDTKSRRPSKAKSISKMYPKLSTFIDLACNPYKFVDPEGVTANNHGEPSYVLSHMIAVLCINECIKLYGTVQIIKSARTLKIILPNGSIYGHKTHKYYVPGDKSIFDLVKKLFMDSQQSDVSSDISSLSLSLPHLSDVNIVYSRQSDVSSDIGSLSHLSDTSSVTIMDSRHLDLDLLSLSDVYLYLEECSKYTENVQLLYQQNNYM